MGQSVSSSAMPVRIHSVGTRTARKHALLIGALGG
jgi:hypothetical protein